MGDPIERLFQKRYLDLHRQRLTSVKPRVDTDPPRGFPRRPNSARGNGTTAHGAAESLLVFDLTDDGDAVAYGGRTEEMCSACHIMKERHDSLLADRQMLEGDLEEFRRENEGLVQELQLLQVQQGERVARQAVESDLEIATLRLQLTELREALPRLNVEHAEATERVQAEQRSHCDELWAARLGQGVAEEHAFRQLLEEGEAVARSFLEDYSARYTRQLGVIAGVRQRATLGELGRLGEREAERRQALADREEDGRLSLTLREAEERRRRQSEAEAQAALAQQSGLRRAREEELRAAVQLCRAELAEAAAARERDALERTAHERAYRMLGDLQQQVAVDGAESVWAVMRQFETLRADFEVEKARAEEQHVQEMKRHKARIDALAREQAEELAMDAVRAWQDRVGDAQKQLEHDTRRMERHRKRMDEERAKREAETLALVREAEALRAEVAVLRAAQDGDRRETALLSGEREARLLEVETLRRQLGAHSTEQEQLRKEHSAVRRELQRMQEEAKRAGCLSSIAVADGQLIVRRDCYDSVGLEEDVLRVTKSALAQLQREIRRAKTSLKLDSSTTTDAASVKTADTPADPATPAPAPAKLKKGKAKKGRATRSPATFPLSDQAYFSSESTDSPELKPCRVSQRKSKAATTEATEDGSPRAPAAPSAPAAAAADLHRKLENGALLEFALTAVLPLEEEVLQLEMLLTCLAELQCTPQTLPRLSSFLQACQEHPISHLDDLLGAVRQLLGRTPTTSSRATALPTPSALRCHVVCRYVEGLMAQHQALAKGGRPTSSVVPAEVVPVPTVVPSATVFEMVCSLSFPNMGAMVTQLQRYSLGQAEGGNPVEDTVGTAFLFGVMGVLACLVPHLIPDTTEGAAWKEVAAVFEFDLLAEVLPITSADFVLDTVEALRLSDPPQIQNVLLGLPYYVDPLAVSLQSQGLTLEKWGHTITLAYALGVLACLQLRRDFLAQLPPPLNANAALRQHVRRATQPITGLAALLTEDRQAEVLCKLINVTARLSPTEVNCAKMVRVINHLQKQPNDPAAFLEYVTRTLDLLDPQVPIETTFHAAGPINYMKLLATNVYCQQYLHQLSQHAVALTASLDAQQARGITRLQKLAAHKKELAELRERQETLAAELAQGNARHTEEVALSQTRLADALERQRWAMRLEPPTKLSLHKVAALGFGAEDSPLTQTEKRFALHVHLVVMTLLCVSILVRLLAPEETRTQGSQVLILYICCTLFCYMASLPFYSLFKTAQVMKWSLILLILWGYPIVFWISSNCRGAGRATPLFWNLSSYSVNPLYYVHNSPFAWMLPAIASLYLMGGSMLFSAFVTFVCCAIMAVLWTMEFIIKEYNWMSASEGCFISSAIPPNAYFYWYEFGETIVALILTAHVGYTMASRIGQCGRRHLDANPHIHPDQVLQGPGRPQPVAWPSPGGAAEANPSDSGSQRTKSSPPSTASQRVSPDKASSSGASLKGPPKATVKAEAQDSSDDVEPVAEPRQPMPRWEGPTFFITTPTPQPRPDRSLTVPIGRTTSLAIAAGSPPAPDQHRVSSMAQDTRGATPGVAPAPSLAAAQLPSPLPPPPLPPSLPPPAPAGSTHPPGAPDSRRPSLTQFTFGAAPPPSLPSSRRPSVTGTGTDLFHTPAHPLLNDPVQARRQSLTLPSGSPSGATPPEPPAAPLPAAPATPAPPVDPPPDAPVPVAGLRPGQGAGAGLGPVPWPAPARPVA